jgi:hypothetical protein
MDIQATAQLLGNFGEFFGAFAVLATLGYLVVQIKQNNKLLTATIYDSAIDGFVANNRIVLESADYASITNRGLADVSQLNEDEAFRFNIGLRSFFFHVYKLYRLYQQRVITEQEWNKYAGDAAAILSTEAGKAFQKGNPDFYEDLFPELEKVMNPHRVSFTLEQ